MCNMTEVFREEGTDMLLVKLICKKLSKGKDEATIIEELEMEDEEERIKAQEMINVANDIGSDYDADRVFEAYMTLQPKV